MDLLAFNDTTRVAGPLLPKGPGPDLAWDATRATLQELLAPGRPGVAVAVVDGDVRVVARAFISVGGHAVFGRHDHVDLVCGRAELSLRQLLLTVEQESESATPRLELRDLGTEQPFRVAGQPFSGLEVHGAAVVELLDLALVVAPSGRPLSAVLGPPEVERAAAPGAFGRVVLVRRVATQSAGITSVRSLKSLFTGEIGVQPELGEPAGSLTLELAGLTRTLELTQARLAHGVTLGRYERCAISLPAEGLSRVHTLLRLAGRRLRVLDLGSTNGTFVDGTRVRDALLLGPARIECGELHLDWRPV